MTGVVVLDYGSGNIRSAERALARAGATVTVTADFDTALEADGLVVPGVGAFQACREGLLSVRGDQLVERRLAARKPVLGICVGMQILFGSGIEHGVETKGCDRWPGVVERLQPGSEPVPHMGWNRVEPGSGSRLFRGIENERFYFVHSYAVRIWTGSPDKTVAWTPYGHDRFLAAVEDGALTATQFHPEKSGDAGAKLLENWLAML